VTDLWTALALVLVIEGAAYTLFPDGMRRMMLKVVTVPSSSLRMVGMVSAILGVAAIWLLRR